MPAKKKAGGKSGASAAKQASLEHEAALLRQEQEKERLRNEEVMLRQRIEEEEYKLLESHRVRETEIHNALAERERKAYYEKREKELMELVETKENYVQEMRAKLLGMQQAVQHMESEKESAVRRAGMLSNELELAQMQYLEAQSTMAAREQSHAEAQSALEGQLDELQKALAELRATHEALQRKHADAIASPAAPGATTSDADRPSRESGAGAGGQDDAGRTVASRDVDAETTVLLRVLHEEVDKYKALATKLQGELERKGHDEEKSSLLMGILNTQLDAVREENRRLHGTAQTRVAELQTAQTMLDEQKAKYRQLYEELDRTTSQSLVQQRQLQLEVEAHKGQVVELTQRLGELSAAHSTLQAQHDEATARAGAREQEDFKANVAMKGELDKLKRELAEVAKEKQAVMDEAFNYKVYTRAETDSLKTRLQRFQETLERKERESYETMAALQTDLRQLGSERDVAAELHACELRRAKEDLERTRDERDRLATTLASLKESSEAKERELYEKLVQLTACHDSKHTELQELRQRLQAKEEEFTHSAIYLNAEKENLSATIATLEEQAREQRQAHLAHIEEISGQLNELQRDITQEMARHEESLRVEHDRATLAERDVARLLQQLGEAEVQTRTTEVQTQETVKTLKADARELRSELSLAKRTIDRLEAAMGDQAAYKQLTELNAKLSQEVGQYKKQVANLSNSLAAMKVEQDMMGGYKLQKAMEEKEQLTRRVKMLEWVFANIMPVFTKLRAFAERRQMPDELRGALQEYDAKATNMPPPSATVAADADAANNGSVVAAVADAAAATAEDATSAAPTDVTATLPAVFRRVPTRPGSAQQAVYSHVEKLPRSTAVESSWQGSCALPAIHSA